MSNIIYLNHVEKMGKKWRVTLRRPEGRVEVAVFNSKYNTMKLAHMNARMLGNRPRSILDDIIAKVTYE